MLEYTNPQSGNRTSSQHGRGRLFVRPVKFIYSKNIFSGCSSRCVRDAEVAGSNPVDPISSNKEAFEKFMKNSFWYTRVLE